MWSGNRSLTIAVRRSGLVGQRDTNRSRLAQAALRSRASMDRRSSSRSTCSVIKPQAAGSPPRRMPNSRCSESITEALCANASRNPSSSTFFVVLANGSVPRRTRRPELVSALSNEPAPKARLTRSRTAGRSIPRIRRASASSSNDGSLVPALNLRAQHWRSGLRRQVQPRVAGSCSAIPPPEGVAARLRWLRVLLLLPERGRQRLWRDGRNVRTWIISFGCISGGLPGD